MIIISYVLHSIWQIIFKPIYHFIHRYIYSSLSLFLYFFFSIGASAPKKSWSVWLRFSLYCVMWVSGWLNTIRSQYLMFTFLRWTQEKRHIVHPWGQRMWCLWECRVQFLLFLCSLQYLVILHRDILAGYNINSLFYYYRNSQCGDKIITRLSYFHNGISYTCKISLS